MRSVPTPVKTLSPWVTSVDKASVRQLFLLVGLTAVGLAFAEAVIKTWVSKTGYNWRSAAASTAIAVGRRFLELIPLWITLPFAFWFYDNRLITLRINGWSILALFILIEFTYYWFHRASHTVRWFWASHAVHHSSNEYNLSIAYRLGWTGQLTGTLIFFSPLAWLGFPPALIAGAFALNLLYQFWIHTDWIPKLGFLEGIINTPSAHRVHHAADLDYLDANYGGVLVIFDRLFGTYIPERADLKPRYGWVEPITSNNPLRILFTAWFALIKDVWHERSWLNKLRLLYKPPGWYPDARSNTTAERRARALVASIQSSKAHF
jgi:sterol desaturase/sphingolipid hydroxylase (fatty acid hydroxylase superfamily)